METEQEQLIRERMARVETRLDGIDSRLESLLSMLKDEARKVDEIQVSLSNLGGDIMLHAERVAQSVAEDKRWQEDHVEVHRQETSRIHWLVGISVSAAGFLVYLFVNVFH